MRELERKRQGEKERYRVQDEPAGGDENSPRRATRQAKAEAGKRKRKRLILVLCAALLAVGIFLLYSPYGLLGDEDSPLAGIISPAPLEEAQPPADEEPAEVPGPGLPRRRRRGDLGCRGAPSRQQDR